MILKNSHLMNKQNYNLNWTYSPASLMLLHFYTKELQNSNQKIHDHLSLSFACCHHPPSQSLLLLQTIKSCPSILETIIYYFSSAFAVPSYYLFGSFDFKHAETLSLWSITLKFYIKLSINIPPSIENHLIISLII